MMSWVFGGELLVKIGSERHWCSAPKHAKFRRCAFVQVLGLTVLAWGNSVGDMSTNMAMARKGLANMAMTACYAGPVFNLLVRPSCSHLPLMLTCSISFQAFYGSGMGASVAYNPLMLTCCISFQFFMDQEWELLLHGIL